MATTKRRKSSSVSEQLFSEGHEFSFFQATRLLQGLVCQWQKQSMGNPVGHDTLPNQETLRFSVPPSLRFPASEVISIGKHLQIIKPEDYDIAEMAVAFMGLSGPSAVLPTFFTEVELVRQREKDVALKDFLDLFNHRTISLFYRAWEKYRLPYNYERFALYQQGDDPFTQVFSATLGVYGEQIKSSLPLQHEELIYYAGFFAGPRRSAAALQSSLSEFLDVSVVVNQFKGEWMTLLDDDRSQLPIFPLKGKNNCLGVDMVIGERYFTVEGKIELEIGPLDEKEFHEILPGSAKHQALTNYVALFVGANLDFDLKYKIKPEAVNRWQLDEKKASSFHLGWNTWLNSDMPRKDNQSVIVHQ